MIFDALLDTILDGIKILPFLFVTYLAMEFLEHKASGKTIELVRKSGKWGPLFGGVLGVIPQCGFSAAGSNLYAGRIITMGTLISIYLSTSDEMLPIMIANKAPITLVMSVLGLKALIGVIVGFIIDLLFRKKHIDQTSEMAVSHICDHEHCHCEEGNILKSSISHSLQIFVFIIIISFALNLLIEYIGEDKLSLLVSRSGVLSIFLSAIVGLIPNCAASVVITELYLEGILSFGAMMSGLLVGAGVGLLVLFRSNEKLLDSLKVTGILYISGVLIGLILLLFGL